MRIAMWSGPRNLSTAMMYSFGSRADFSVVDEPFYAAYLAKTGLQHPMRDQILAAQPRDPFQVEKYLLGPIPGARPHFYQKHMTQHMIQGVPREWMQECVNVFLIRHPARVLASFAAKYEHPTLADIGFVQQAQLFEEVSHHQGRAIVIDSSDIRKDPEKMLKRLCDAIGLSWDSGMLAWSAGGHADDGVWAAHWYGAVHRSTGFAAAEGPVPEVPDKTAEIVEAALPYYQKLFKHRL